MNFTNDIHNMLDIQSPTIKSRMTCFEPATADKVRKLITNSLPKDDMKNYSVKPKLCIENHRKSYRKSNSFTS